jgi:hypothetical protein
MKPRIGLAGLASLCFAAAAPLFAQFEGVADFKITMRGENTQGMQSSGKIYIGSGGYRSEWEADVSRKGAAGDSAAKPQHFKMTMVGKKSDPDHLYLVNDENKTYSVTDLKKMRENAGDLPKQTYTVQKLGSDTVAGIPCQKASLTSSKGDVFDVCVRKEWGASTDLISALTRNRRSNSWFTALKDNGIEGFPVRFGTRPKADAEPTMVWELTHVEKKAPPASVFDVPPPGYRQTDWAVGGLTPEQEKAIADAKARMLEHMTPEQRKAYEDAMRKSGQAQPTPNP